ncbi:NAD-dependent epimerase/dehydratase family protein [Salibacterium salarium]|uniref:UDP-glucose 4-epimerase n=1 Tax=Salibacterium salarium TaxID=284579 RepID=A0A3R9PYG2_9BACI|nr:NAD-dependent epimerase/dehydratase family protein [Salibacterium salarium]RSL29763.1 NAD-dependent epimerase/dehydratase family protein [Salibacterium salarium]
MDKVLVTGGCGFIGSHIVDQLLEEGYETIVVDNLVSGKLENIDKSDVSFYLCNINSAEFQTVVETESPRYIIHQAAQVSVPSSLSDIFHDENINIRGSLNVMEAAKNNNVEKIVFASSAAVYGEPQYLPIDEEHPIAPLAPYGVSKYAVEKYLEMAHQLYGIDYTILRYSNVYGPRQDAKGEGGVISIFKDKMEEGQNVVVYGNGEQTRDFIHVYDVAKTNVKAMKSETTERIFNLSTNDTISLNELIPAMEKAFDEKVSTTYKDAREGDITHSCLNNEKLQKYLNANKQYLIEVGLDTFHKEKTKKTKQ